MTLTKQARKNLILYGSLVGVALSGFIAGFFHLPRSSPIFTLWFVATMAIASVAAFYCWSLLDEAQKEAHKWAWYWGGSCGMLGGFIALMFASRVNPRIFEILEPDLSAKAFVHLGFAAAALSMLIGYGVAWAVWWLRRR